MARADSSLNDAGRETARRLAEFALPPVADAYLKVRLAQSDVERYNSLLDAIEAIVRVAALALLVDLWSHGLLKDKPEARKKGLTPPITFGGWVYLLNDVWLPTAPSSLMGDKVGQFLGSGMMPMQARMEQEALSAGLNQSEFEVKNQFEWIKWIKWLRNVTKGHGPVDENLAGRLWDHLHAAFLEMAEGLDYLLTKSALIILCDGKTQLLGGWYRGRKRAFQGPLNPEVDAGFNFALGNDLSVYLRSPNGELLFLTPFLQCDTGNVLMWSGSRAITDFGTGQIHHLELLSNATAERVSREVIGPVLFEDWREKRSASQFLAIQRIVREGPP